MTDWSYDPYDPIITDRPSLSRKIFVKPSRPSPLFPSALWSHCGSLADWRNRLPLPLRRRSLRPRFAFQADAVPVTVALKTGAAKEGGNPFGALFDQDGALVGAPANTRACGASLLRLAVPAAFRDGQSGRRPAARRRSGHAASGGTRERAADGGASPATAGRRGRTREFPFRPRARRSLPSNRASPIRPSPLLPPPRSLENATPRKEAPPASVRDKAQATTLSQNDPRNFFEKLLGAGQGSNAPERKGQQLAYASPDGGLFNPFRGATSTPSPVTATGGTAVYDIAAHTVYLPNGQSLEAHSGLGPYFDNPNYVHVRMRGATPPAVYNLTMRESLFHGVQALRLTPVSGSTYGRNGLLAHTFMLGQRGDSNGCVSFRNYRAFLQAYMNGEVRRLVVVSRRS